MRSFLKNQQKIIHAISWVTLLFIVCIGALMVLFEVKPFWVDEWFIIDNLKTKDTTALFGQLDFMQQFPRVYLVLLKSVTSFFNYNYFSLRLPSFLVSVSTIMLTCKMMKKIYDEQNFVRYLFVLILVSSFTFIEYFVEIKQYPMEILMSIVALWQLTELLSLPDNQHLRIARYLILCASFIVAPFFSYTYPIVIAPVYGVIFLQTIFLLKNADLPSFKRRMAIMQWATLVVCATGIFLFYEIDAKHLAADKKMYNFWSFLIFDHANKLHSFLTGFYTLFSQTGNGLLFETLFGILGISAFICGLIYIVKGYRKNADSLGMQLTVYSCLLLVLTLILFLCKKLPLGTPRLNAFTTPSITILIIYLLNRLSMYFRRDWQKMILPVILYVGVIGNIFTHYINFFTSPVYKKQMSIYTATEDAIRLAQRKKIPILITSGVCFPYEQATKDAGAPDPAVWVLKTFPEYSINDHLPVYEIKDIPNSREYIGQLPHTDTAAIVGDGISFKIYHRSTQ